MTNWCKSCDWCGRTYTQETGEDVPDWPWATRRYCSRACKRDHQEIIAAVTRPSHPLIVTPAEAARNLLRCPDCGGTGEVPTMHRTLHGRPAYQTCDTCGGTGRRPLPEFAEIRLTNGKPVVVDAADVEFLSQYTWVERTAGHGFCRTSYAMAMPQRDGVRKGFFMHRLLLNAQPDQFVDHIDGDGLNNTRANLRFATRSQNGANAAPSSRNTSGYKGVYFSNGHGKWAAAIRVEGARTYLGFYDTKEEAALAYNAAAIKAHGDFAYLNEVCPNCLNRGYRDVDDPDYGVAFCDCPAGLLRADLEAARVADERAAERRALVASDPLDRLPS